jgi:hypothetical protein
LTELASVINKQKFAAIFFLRGFHHHISKRKTQTEDNVLLVLLATLPLFPEIQEKALGILIDKNRWDILQHLNVPDLSE